MIEFAGDIKSIYIHIPFCLSKCKYCDFFSISCNNKKNPVPDDYISSILNELAFYINQYEIKNIRTIYIGGGTPSLLSKNQLNQIFSFLQNNLNFNDEYEFTIEMNPDDVTEDFIQFLQNSPVNRISCGIQSMNQKVLKNVNRRAGVKENLNALNIFKKYWKKTLSLDFICGLPLEKTDEFIEGIKSILDYEPHHISMYSLTIEEETALGQDLENNIFEYDFDYADEMWLKTKSMLEEKGYVQYEISNFCKKGFECLHNLSYWNHENYLGIGAGATGSLYYKDGSGVRFFNQNNINDYIEFWLNKWKETEAFQNNLATICQKEIVDIQTSQFEFFMMGLRKANGISEIEYEKCFNKNIPEKVVKQFEKWVKKGLAHITKSENDVVYSLNREGLLFLNPFLEELEF